MMRSFYLLNSSIIFKEKLKNKAGSVITKKQSKKISNNIKKSKN
ncbi:uncharacterized protein METZ01_LOCUS157196 [marine metagenome]|uniref:Uncharacterized protein n=1 Tax=marine metagenome TaxID=408172 RepID=A0A382ATE6_9ZZZZ|tara:strand:+ start:618 stop:749 length:132 start_codon:yes stop_codon:yes gene_type:complete